MEVVPLRSGTALDLRGFHPFSRYTKNLVSGETPTRHTLFPLYCFCPIVHNVLYVSLGSGGSGSSVGLERPCGGTCSVKLTMLPTMSNGTRHHTLSQYRLDQEHGQQCCTDVISSNTASHSDRIQRVCQESLTTLQPPSRLLLLG